MTRPPFSIGPVCLTFLLIGIIDPGDLWADPPADVRDAREVTFQGHGDFELKGTILLPAEISPAGAPALVLLPGSGPTDRNGNQPPILVTDLLKDVAERLADEGYATLRFDKRAAHVYLAKLMAMGPEELRDFLGFDAFVGDARAAVELLRATEGVDARRIGIFGHSEGGLFALQLAKELGHGADGVVALVLAATPGRSMADVLRYQIGRNLRALEEEDRTRWMNELDRAMASVIETGRAPGDLDRGFAGLFPMNATKLLQVELALDPAALAGVYAGPVLVLQGERDVQVLADVDAPLLEAALVERTKGVCRVAVIPAASHNFKHVESEEELGMEGDVVSETFEALVPWLRENLPVLTPVEAGG